jgi:hypothetical protein
MDSIHLDRPTFKETLIFKVKSTLLKLRCIFRNKITHRLPKHNANDRLIEYTSIAFSASALWNNTNVAEMNLTAGKVQNLRVACAQLNGVEVEANKVLSFWKQVGKATKARGFVAGRELREGCLIPTVGGGLCQLSNALYDAALKANFEILERHAHTNVIKGSLAERGRDATVYWNYVDLKFKSEHSFRIEAFLTKDQLIVRFRGQKPALKVRPKGLQPKADLVHNCYTCNQTDCFRNEPATADQVTFGKTAWLVDEFWPEYNQYLRQHSASDDMLLIPLDGTKWRKANYAWATAGFSAVKSSTLTALRRARAIRKTAKQGKALQTNVLLHSAKLASGYAKQLDFEVGHVVVAQNLLPALYKSGALGGRTYDVLMTRLPMSVLQQRLDDAASKHCGSGTLKDFRADESLLRLEEEALRHANKIITPHCDIAKLFGERAVLLDWMLPCAEKRAIVEGKTVLFPASALGRKGVYELRHALRGLDVELIVMGDAQEKVNIWGELTVISSAAGWQKKVDLVVLPAFIEHQPRVLLKALALGIPVLASEACGLGARKGVTTIATPTAGQLRESIVEILRLHDSSGRRAAVA